MWGLPPPIVGLIILIAFLPMFVIVRQSGAMRSKLERYVAAPPSPTEPQLPPEVRAIFDEAKARATAVPTDAQAIALEYGQHVPAPNRENLVRLVYYTAGCAQGMHPRQAVDYASKMWAQTRESSR